LFQKKKEIIPQKKQGLKAKPSKKKQYLKKCRVFTNMKLYCSRKKQDPTNAAANLHDNEAKSFQIEARRPQQMQGLGLCGDKTKRLQKKQKNTQQLARRQRHKTRTTKATSDNSHEGDVKNLHESEVHQSALR
jgi:hypothetical protein